MRVKIPGAVAARDKASDLEEDQSPFLFKRLELADVLDSFTADTPLSPFLKGAHDIGQNLEFHLHS